jgi:hypothetical protein
MALPKREARIAQLILRGFQPSVAERIVADCERDEQRIIPAAEAGWLADPQPGDEEAARLWWYWSPDVPTAMRRILDARVIERDRDQGSGVRGQADA